MKHFFVCSKKSDLVTNVGKLKDWFKESGYLEDMVNKETKRALEIPSLGCSKTSERSVSDNCGTGVPLVVNYNPVLCRLGQVIHENLCFLYQNEEVKQVFNPVLFVSLRCHVRYVVCNTTVKQMMNSDTGGIIIRITIKKKV